MIREAFGPEAAPIIRHDLVECVDHIVERIGFERWSGAGCAVKEMAEVVDGLLALALLPDDDVDPEPVQRVFIVEVGAAAPGVPRLRREIKLRGGVGGVLQVAPLAAGKVVELGGSQGKIVAVLIGAEQAASRGEHEAEIVGQALVDPKQVVLHGLLIVGRREIGGTAIFSIPAMSIFVGQKPGGQLARGVVDQGSFIDAAVVGFVVLESEVRNVIAERIEKMIIAVVMRAEEFLRLVDEIFVVLPNLLRRFERGGAVGSNVHFSGRILRERNYLQEFSSDYGRIDQRGERRGCEVDFIAALADNRQRSAELPSFGNLQ